MRARAMPRDPIAPTAEPDFPEKLEAYAKRLSRKDAEQIRPDHVRRILEKLEARRREIRRRMATGSPAGEMARDAARLAVLDHQIDNARHLMEQVSSRSAGRT